MDSTLLVRLNQERSECESTAFGTRFSFTRSRVCGIPVRNRCQSITELRMEYYYVGEYGNAIALPEPMSMSASGKIAATQLRL